MKRALVCLLALCGSLSAEVKFERLPEGGIQPQVVQETDGRVHMIYFQGDPMGGDIYYATQAPDEDRFSKSIRVNSNPGSAIAVGTMRGPQLAVGRGGEVHVAWMGGNGATKVMIEGVENTPMVYTRLASDHKSFEPERAVNTKVGGLDGGGSVAADQKGNVWVIWHGVPPGVKGEENRSLFVAHSTDAGKTFATEWKANTPESGACACCGMKAFAGKDGELFVLYRTVQESLKRPETLLVSRDQGKSFKTLLTDMWETSTCPASSVSIQPSKQGIISAWETRGNVFASTFINGKRESPVSPERGVKRKFPFALSNSKGETLLTWVEDVGWGTEGKLGWQVFPEKSKPHLVNKSEVPKWSFAQGFVDNKGDFVIVY